MPRCASCRRCFAPSAAWPAFQGPAATLQCFEDNSLVRQALEEPGNGRVLVIDAGGSLRCALVGGNLAAIGAKNGWAGIVIDGCVRDQAEMAALPSACARWRCTPSAATSAARAGAMGSCGCKA